MKWQTKGPRMPPRAFRSCDVSLRLVIQIQAGSRRPGDLDTRTRESILRRSHQTGKQFLRLLGMPSQHVGLFWLVQSDHRILVYSTPLDQAEKYGRYLIHGRSHIDVWERWKREGKVPADLEYDQVPRGGSRTTGWRNASRSWPMRASWTIRP